MIRKVIRNVGFNVIGVMLPTIVGVLSVPILLNNIGTDRLGVFTLALGLIGFAGIFDLGLGRALTHTVATATGKGRPLAVIAGHVRRTLPIVLLMGMAWGAILWMSARPLAEEVFQLQDSLAAESELGIRWLALAIPVLLVSTSLIGTLEGLQRFALVNLLRVPLGAMAFLVPALTSFVFQDVGHVIASLVAVRLLGLILWLVLLFRALPMFAPEAGERIAGGEMWRFTGWLTVSNLVGPLMVHADRFYLAAIFPPAIVAYYTVPLDTLFRASSLPQAGMNAVFPALAHAGISSRDSGRMIRYATWAMLGLWALPLTSVALLMNGLLSLWLGQEFASAALTISQWLLIGVMVNGFANIPYAMLQSAGRADLTAKLHVIELPLYGALIVLLVQGYGILGAALAWTARALFDTVMLYWLTHRHFSERREQLSLSAGMAAAAAVALFVINII